MTDPIKTVEAALEGDAAKEDAAIQAAVHAMHQRALEFATAEIAKALAAEKRVLAWAKAKRLAFIGVGIGLIIVGVIKFLKLV